MADVYREVLDAELFICNSVYSSESNVSCYNENFLFILFCLKNIISILFSGVNI
jgi:hypothetical protein